MTTDPYGWKAKYFQARRDYARLLETINGIALTAESQLDAQNDVDLVRVKEHYDLEEERDRVQKRSSEEYHDHIDTMRSLSHLLAQALGHLRTGRKKKALELVGQAAHTVNSQIAPF